MHLLMGGTARATDYEQLTFSRCVLLDKDLVLIYRQSRKTTLLNAAQHVTPAVLPRKLFDHVLHYWNLVRPFCSVLAAGNKVQSAKLERWQRYCFVKGARAAISKAVHKQLGDGCTFQRLRHASEAIFRSVILPKELDLRQEYNYDRLFGHQYRTGLSYGVLSLAGSDKRHAGTDISSVSRCLKAWWHILKIDFKTDTHESQRGTYCESEGESDNASESEFVGTYFDDNEGDNASESEVVETESSVDDHSEACVGVDAAARAKVNCSPESAETTNKGRVDVSVEVGIDVEDAIDGASETDDGDVGDRVDIEADVEVGSHADVSDAFDRVQKDDIHFDAAAEAEEVDTTLEQDSDTTVVAKLGFPRFRSEAQRCLIQHVLKCETSVAGVLPTGAGKTLAIFVAMAEKEPGITVAIYPLRSVFDDALVRLKELSLKMPKYKDAWTTWDQRFPLRSIFAHTKLMLVTAEQARNNLFLSQLRKDHSLVRRVVFDEAPVFGSSSYRLGLASLPTMIRSLVSCPFVLLTATLPCLHERRLRESFHCPGLVVIRAPTIRPEVVHKLIRLPSGSVDMTRELVKYVNVENNKLTIVFVKSKNDLQNVANALEVVPITRGRVARYHGSLDGDQRKLAAHSWSCGQKPVMVATTAFAYGIHDSKCHLVIHVDGAFDVETYVQATGRSGRDGKTANSIVLLSGASSKRCDKTEFDRFARSNCCRLVSLSSLLDPIELQWKKSCGRCDHCSRMGLPVHNVSMEWRQQSCNVYWPGQAVTPLQERVAANCYLAKVRKSLKSLMKVCKQHFCFSCFVQSRGRKRLAHGITSCPLWKFRCFRCASTGCKRRECATSDWINKQLKTANLCVSCAMPPQVFDVVVHAEEFSMGKHCHFRDTVLPVLLLLWKNMHTKAAIVKFASLPLNNFEQYMKWALDANGGLSNGLRFITQYCFK